MVVSHFNESGDGITRPSMDALQERVEEIRVYNEVPPYSRCSVKELSPNTWTGPGCTSALKTANETVGTAVSVILTVQNNVCLI
jgi:hypothetical protein